MQWILLLLTSYGLAFALMNDKWPISFLRLRRSEFLTKMLDCPFCTGFHTGYLTYLLAMPFDLSVPFFIGMTTFAFASSAFCYALDVLIVFLEKRAGE